VSRASVPKGAIREYEKTYPFGWLGVLADVPPVSPHAIVYGNSERGFSLCSMRSLTRSRYYVQCPLDDKVEDWSDQRFWDELRRRLDPATWLSASSRAPASKKASRHCAALWPSPCALAGCSWREMRRTSCRPTGAKGLNLACQRRQVLLASAFVDLYRRAQRRRVIDTYSRALPVARVWKAERFSWWLTSLMHRIDDTGA
jgi:p-hydroxybenzoate 3-monooxygenase